MGELVTVAGVEVLVQGPEDFEEWWGEHWEIGQHVCFVGPTGTGKTTASKTVLRPRRYVLALDPKGGDETLRKLGYPRLTKWPPPRSVWKDIEDGKPARYIVGSVPQTPAEYGALSEMLRACLDDVFAVKHFTLYIDELEVAARFMRLAASIELFLIAARNRGISVVTAFQRPAHVPTAASTQSSWLATFYTRDTEAVRRLAEMAGRPSHEVRALVKALPAWPYSLALFSRNPAEPIIITKPRKAD